MSTSTDHSPYSTQSFDAIASSWGYDGHIRSARKTRSLCGSPIAHGAVGLQEFHSGIRWCSSDLLTLQDNTREAVLPRSLTVFVVTHGGPLHWHYVHGKRGHAGVGNMAVCAVQSKALLAQTLHAGQRMGCLAIQVQPDQIRDAQLADQVDRLLRRTQICPLDNATMHRVVQTSSTISEFSGLAQAMYCEGQALSILAHGLDALDHIREHTTSLHPADQRRLKRLCEQLQSDPMAHYTLSQLARDASLSLTALKDKFPLYAGCSVFEYLREQRFLYARNGLLREGWSVKQAAYSIGYRHPANFSTAFRRRFGTSPSDI